MLKLAVAQELSRMDAPVDALFEAQKAAAVSPARFKAIRTPRRAGKSTTILSRFLQLALTHPKSKFPYIMLTRGQAKDVAWPVLKDLDDRFKANLKYNESELFATLPNGSIIALYGADRPGWMARMRGSKNRAAAVDEAQDFSIDLKEMVYQILRPTLIDLQGELFLAGTPGKIKTGLFYHVTNETGKYAGWELHRWGTADNPHVREQYLAEIEQIKADHPGINIMELPWVRREYFGEWVVDDSDAVYSFAMDNNAAYQWQKEPGDEFVCGIDLGWHDRTAFVVGCYNETRPDFTIVESYRHPKMQLDDAARLVRDLENQYPGIAFVADPARRQLLEELQTRADVFIQAAEKQEKKDWIEIVNRDFVRGRIKVLNPEKSVLAQEMLNLKWQKRPSGIVVEHPSMPNDACDAFLYAYRRAYHYQHEPQKEKPHPGTPEYYRQEADELKKAAIRRVRQEQGDGREWWERA